MKEKGPIQESLNISFKTCEFLTHLGEIREVTNGKVKEALVLKPFYESMQKVALEKGLTGFFRVSIQQRSGSSWQTFSGEIKPWEESLITSENTFDLNDEQRRNYFSHLHSDTNQQHGQFCRPGGGYMGQENVTSIEQYLGLNYHQSNSARIVLTFGQFYNIPENEEQGDLNETNQQSGFNEINRQEIIRRIRKVGISEYFLDKQSDFNKTNKQGIFERTEALQYCLYGSLDKINSLMEQVDDVRLFLNAPTEEWEQVFNTV